MSKIRSLFGRVKLAFNFWLGRRLPSCEVVTRMMSDAMDRRLPLKERIQVKLHLMICVWCTRYGEQIVLVRNALRQHPDKLTQSGPAPKGSDSLSPDARDRMKKMLGDKGDTN